MGLKSMDFCGHNRLDILRFLFLFFESLFGMDGPFLCLPIRIHSSGNSGFRPKIERLERFITGVGFRWPCNGHSLGLWKKTFELVFHCLSPTYAILLRRWTG